MIMTLEKRDQILKLSDRNKFPYIPSPVNSQPEKKLFDCKESDFIKRIKRAKSIMIAHKNRKQKNVLNAYFMQSSKLKKSTAHQKSNESISSDMKMKQKAMVEDKNEINLLPPVHSSIQINMNIRKSKNILLVEPICSSDQISQSLSVFSTKLKKQSSILKSMKRYKQIEINTSVQSCPRWQQNQRECINYTSIKINKPLQENNFNHQLCQKLASTPFAGRKKYSNHFRSLTEQKDQANQVQRGQAYQVEKIERWQFAEDQFQIQQK